MEIIVSQQVRYMWVQVAVWVSLGIQVRSKATILESASSPVLFAPAGEIELSGQYYYVSINVNFQGLRDALDPIASALRGWSHLNILMEK